MQRLEWVTQILQKKKKKNEQRNNVSLWPTPIKP